MDSKSWDSLAKSQREDLLRNIKLSSALAQLRWSSLTKGERKKIEGASKGKGWHEEQTEEVVTKKGVEKKAPKHRDVAIQKRDKELLDKPINPAPEKKEPWQMKKEEYRRTKVSDEELAYRPKLEDRARAEDSTLEQRKGVEYSSGKAKQTLGAPNTAQAVLDSLDARIRLAYKRHRWHVEKAISEGKPVPEEVLKEYSDPIEKPSRKDGANNMPMVKEQQTEEFIQANLNLDKGLEGLSGTGCVALSGVQGYLGWVLHGGIY